MPFFISILLWRKILQWDCASCFHFFNSSSRFSGTASYIFWKVVIVSLFCVEFIPLNYFWFCNLIEKIDLQNKCKVYRFFSTTNAYLSYNMVSIHSFRFVSHFIKTFSVFLWNPTLKGRKNMPKFKNYWFLSVLKRMLFRTNWRVSPNKVFIDSCFLKVKHTILSLVLILISLILLKLQLALDFLSLK